MSARAIAGVLGRACRSGAWWRCRCPVHDSAGGSLALRDGNSGLIVKCFAGCESRDVLAELRRLGLIEDRGERRSEPRQTLSRHDDDSRRQIVFARQLWDAGQDPCGSPVERYLRSRGIDIPVPLCLHWAPACRHPGGRVLPAMLARIDNVNGEQIGCHRTYLRPDGSGKAAVDPIKAMLGRAAGGAVRLAPAAETLMVGEGLENCLAAMQATAMPAWAALSTSGLIRLVLPAEVRAVIALADHDLSGAGERAARGAAARWESEGRRVSIWMSPHVGEDANDRLLATADAEARRAA